MRRVVILVFSLACLVFFVLLVSGYVVQGHKNIIRHTVEGTVLSLTATDLAVQNISGDSIRTVHNFILTPETRFIGAPAVGKMVRVIYHREQFNKRFLRQVAISVEEL